MEMRSGNGGQQGFSLLEVLIAVLLVSLGLLGVAGLQARASSSEFESYQRVQALVLVGDMLERLKMNRAYLGDFKTISNATTGSGYVGSDGVGKFVLGSCSAQTSHALQALCDWDLLLRGAAETTGGNKVGAMTGARGCVTYDVATELAGLPDSGEFTVAVVWQGVLSTAAPTIGNSGQALNCANNLYKDAAGNADEGLRRGIAIKFRFAKLD